MKVATRTQELTPNQIFRAVSRITRIEIRDLKTPNGKRDKRDARKICSVLIYDKGGYSLSKTADMLSLINHTTIIHAKRSYSDLLDSDKVFREKVNKVKLLLGIS